METKNNVEFKRTPFFGWECLICGKVVKTFSILKPSALESLSPESSGLPCPDSHFLGMHVWERITPISKLRDKIIPQWKEAKSTFYKNSWGL